MNLKYERLLLSKIKTDTGMMSNEYKNKLEQIEDLENGN